jgi:hypothetical protein
VRFAYGQWASEKDLSQTTHSYTQNRQRSQHIVLFTIKVKGFGALFTFEVDQRISWWLSKAVILNRFGLAMRPLLAAHRKSPSSTPSPCAEPGKSLEFAQVHAPGSGYQSAGF